jgi:hypothetical protein
MSAGNIRHWNDDYKVMIAMTTILLIATQLWRLHMVVHFVQGFSPAAISPPTPCHIKVIKLLVNPKFFQ